MISVFITLFVCLFLSLPIGLALLIACASAYLSNPALTSDALFIYRSMVTGMDSFTFLAIPLFIFSGNLMAQGGISDRLFTFFAYIVGDKTAGMPIAVVISCLFYGAITGSGPATVAAIGTMTIPLLCSLGYEKSFITALVAVAGGLGVIIPPSIPFVVYGQTANVSVASLFTGGILPGILIGLFLMIVAYFHCKKNGEDKEKLMANYKRLHERGLWRTFKDSFFALLTPVIILGGIYSGLVTPTEAACVSVFYALIISIFVYKSMTLKSLPGILVETTKGMIPMLFVATCATVFARVLALLQAPQIISASMLSVFSSKVAVLLVINLLLLIMGMLIDTTSAIMICTPLLLPIILAIGMSPIHFGIMMTCNLAIGFVTPPVGVNLFVASSLTGMPVLSIVRHATKFIIAFMIALLLITFIPEISLFLVDL